MSTRPGNLGYVTNLLAVPDPDRDEDVQYHVLDGEGDQVCDEPIEVAYPERVETHEVPGEWHDRLCPCCQKQAQIDPTKTILGTSGLNEKYLCDYVLNVATGCRHGCTFCYVYDSSNILARQDMLADQADVDDARDEWGEYVLYRDHIPTDLPGLLDRKRSWKHTEKGQGVVGLSFHTDAFMDARAADISRAAIETLTDHEKYVRVLTRNPVLAKQSLDTFQAAGDHLTVGSSINSLDDDRLRGIEQQAPPPTRRLEGLREISQAGVQTWVSMSPTYPTMDRADLRELMAAIATVDPEVVFHEPINPKGKTFQRTIDAAWAAGDDELGAALADLRRGWPADKSRWVEYACQHFRWVQELARETGLDVHLWPDKTLVDAVDGERERWLQSWLDRTPRESFAGRTPPESELPAMPASRQATFADGLQ